MEDDFEEFDFMMFSQLEDTRDVLFSILQDRSLPLTLRMSASRTTDRTISDPGGRAEGI